MTIGTKYLTGCVVALAAMAVAPPSLAIDPARLEAAEQTPNDWLTYHGGYKSYHYSALDQINASNVKNLEVAWIHMPGRSTRGLQSMPLVADGVLYYSGSYSRVYALDGATGKLIWSYFPQLDEHLVSMQTHSPYNRGTALGDGKVFVGTVDGRLIALDMKSGKPLWDTRLVDSKKLTVGFTGAPLVVKDTVIIGSQGGEWTSRGPLFGVNIKTGKKKWEFFTVAGTEDAKATWGNESWRTGGGGAWMPGGYDPETNTIWGEDIAPKPGKLMGGGDLSLGKASTPLCRAIAGGVSGNSGAYSPKTGLWYKIAKEWCMEVDVVQTTPITEPMAQLNIGANFKLVPPPDGPARGHLDARDPVTGDKKWEVTFHEPPLASVLATAGNLVFVPDSRGVLHAYNAENGQELWSHYNGVGHNGGIISYSAGGKQYIAVPAGWGGMVADELPPLFGEPYKSMPKDARALIGFTLKQQ